MKIPNGSSEAVVWKGTWYNGQKKDPNTNNGQQNTTQKKDPNTNNGQQNTTQKRDPNTNNGQQNTTQKRDPKTNNGQQNTTQKSKGWATGIPWVNGGELWCSG